MIFFLPSPATISAKQDSTSATSNLMSALGTALRLSAIHKAAPPAFVGEVRVIFTLEIDFSPYLVSVIPSISSLESREHNRSFNRFRFLDKLLILQ